MKRILLAGSAVLLAGLILLSACSNPKSNSDDISKLQIQTKQQQDKIANLQSESQQQLAQIASLESEKQQQQNQLGDLQSKMDKSQTEKDNLTSQVNALTSIISRLNSEIQSLTDAKTDADLQLQQAQAEIKALRASTPDNISTLISQISSLTTQINKLQSDRDNLNFQVALLTKQVTPSPDHAFTWTQISTDPTLVSTAWAGRDSQWHDKIKEIGALYHGTHVYIQNETDCDDMAVDIWNMLLAQNIKSVIVVGNLDKKNASFAETNHAWLVVYNAQGQYAILEPTTGEIIYAINMDGTHNTKIDPYYGGWAYKKPSDLWQDVKKKW